MEEKERKTFVLRFRGMGAVVVLVFLILAFNLWRLQIAQGSYYSEMARTNYTQTVPLPATRGDIIDSKGKLLATSVPRLALTLDWLELQNAKGSQWKDVIKSLAVYIKGEWPNQNQSPNSITEDILAMIQNHQWERYRPVTILTDVSNELRATIAEHQEELPGVSVVALPVRSYPDKTIAGQILGYVREISEEEIDQFNKDPLAQKDGFQYSQGDLVGKMGVEKSYDYWLRGREGVQVAEVDNNNRPIIKKVLKPAEVGKTVQLTLDADLQKVMQDALDNVIKTVVQPEHPDVQQGAAVVIDVNTGKILAMVSRPYMDPNDLIGTISDEMADKYFTSKDAASFNRALSGVYPPGSTYKMITAMAALQSKVTTPNEYVYDDMSSLGSREAQKSGFAEWGNMNFGRVNLTRALAKSSNIYFQVMGRRVFDAQPELMRQISNEFGLGVVSGVDIPGEAKGIAPSEEWKKSYYKPTYDKMREQKLAAIESDYSVRIAQAADDKSKKKLVQERDRKKAEVETWYKQMLSENVDWHLYDSFNNSIGQGYNAYTPLQLANYVATIVNGGKHMRPYIVDKIIDPVNGSVVYQNKPQVLNTVSVSPENLEIVKAGMREVTRGEGTANFMSIQIPEFTGGGKTGTAQIGSKDTVAGNLYNGLFVAFAPYDNPQIAFAGVVEYGGHGGTTAGLVAKAAFMQYFGWKSTNGG
ncbi:penicillin-binding protein 2 [Paradesulfitobacterium ferrireducens]|uniref:penicillin-binding protein 2 n=1 Tax=Paradesulfitobacterium ferrireducens TaxID=2816476 RepID=UPI001A8D7B6C|nr:penicillin-binding protein 2 [Paradesulfitobacterium ferrireducens]